MDKSSRYVGGRIELVGLREDDAEDVVRWRSDPANYSMFFRKAPLAMEEHLAWFRAYLSDDTRYDFVIKELSTGVSVGTAGLSNIDRDAATCEISYMLGERSARGKGYATEAVELLCGAATRELGVKVIEARILPQNQQSMHVAERAGFEESHRVFRREIAP